MIHSKPIPYLSNAAIVLFLLLGNWCCQSEAPVSEDTRETYLRAYVSDGDFFPSDIAILANGEKLISTTSFADFNSTVLVKVDANGNFISKTKYQTESRWSLPFLDRLSDRKIIISNWLAPTAYVLDQDGNKLSGGSYFPGLANASTQYQFSRTVESDDGFLYISATNGPAHSGLSSNLITKLDRNGDFVEARSFHDEYFDVGNKFLSFNIFKEKDGNYSVIGNHFPNWVRADWGAPERLYVAKFGSGAQMVNYIPFTDSLISQVLNSYIETSDGNLVVLVARDNYLQIDFKESPREFELIKIDQDLNLLWKKTIEIEGINQLSLYNMSELENGNILLTGACLSKDGLNPQPCIIVTDKNGAVLFYKVYNLGGTSYFFCGKQDGEHLIFAGTSNTLGRGHVSNQLLVVRTDLFGNY
ncbi:MAG: hypothetical protein H6606_03885 [Flavobacteriales bacterium]|nr:hypothetical protein [Flavobacteriales bacterium]